MPKISQNNSESIRRMGSIVNSCEEFVLLEEIIKFFAIDSRLGSEFQV